jgi:hypothetical protein
MPDFLANEPLIIHQQVHLMHHGVPAHLSLIVYVNNLHDLEALKQNIREAIYNTQQCELQQVSQNLLKRIQACLTAEGRHFHHLL